jgi:hypothetical protein
MTLADNALANEVRKPKVNGTLYVYHLDDQVPQRNLADWSLCFATKGQNHLPENLCLIPYTHRQHEDERLPENLCLIPCTHHKQKPHNRLAQIRAYAEQWSGVSGTDECDDVCSSSGPSRS